MPTMSLVEQGFCRSAPWRWVARRVILPWALQGLEPHGKLLELGAGSGAMAASTAENFPGLHLTVSDIDPAMVAVAKQRLAGHSHATVQQADVTRLPFADESFDCVASHLMLHHVLDWERSLNEAVRVLRPGGIFIGYDLTSTRVAEWVHRADRSPHRLIDHDAFRPALEAAALESVDVRRGLGGLVVRFSARRPGDPEVAV